MDMTEGLSLLLEVCERDPLNKCPFSHSDMIPASKASLNIQNSPPNTKPIMRLPTCTLRMTYGRAVREPQMTVEGDKRP